MFEVKPFFNGQNFDKMYFAVDSVNSFAKKEIYDTFDFYQSTFGVYGQMQVSKDLTFRLHWIDTVPFVWQPHNDCAWTPTNGVSAYSTEIVPDRVKLNEEYCYDMLFDSTFGAALSWGGNGQMTDDAIGYFNELSRKIVQRAAIGARATMVAGKLASLQNATFNAGTSTVANLQSMWNTTIGTHKGWLQGLADLAAANPTQNGNVNIAGLFNGQLDASGQKFTGNVIDFLATDIYNAASGELQEAVDTGGLPSIGGMQPQALYMVTPSIFNRIREQYNDQQATALSNGKRITKIPYKWNGSDVYVYFIDDVAVVPIREVNTFSKYVNGTYHAAYLTFSGNIQIGGSFNKIPSLDNNAAIAIQKRTDLDKLGKYQFLAHYLMSNGICDTNYICGGQEFRPI